MSAKPFVTALKMQDYAPLRTKNMLPKAQNHYRANPNCNACGINSYEPNVFTHMTSSQLVQSWICHGPPTHLPGSLNPIECEAVVQAALLQWPSLCLLPAEDVLPPGCPRGSPGLETWAVPDPSFESTGGRGRAQLYPDL